MIRTSFTAVSLCVFLLISCKPSVEETHNSNNETTFFNPALERQVDSLLALMTLEEKSLMLHGTGKFVSGGVARLGIEEITHADGPLGVREELEKDSWNPLGLTTDSATFFPAGGALAATWNVTLAHQYGAAIGAEARARGKDILLAPAINIIRSPLGGRNYEYFSEDPYLIAQMAVPYVLGVQKQDVAACVKHFAVNNQESYRRTVSAEVDERALREIYLRGFEATVKEAGAYTVMGAYNKFRGDYLCENDYMLNTILKNEWGFKGAVISDWNATHSTVKSAKNGLDIEMGTHIDVYDDWYFAQPLIDSVKQGELEESVVDDHVKRVLRVALNIKKTDSTRQAGSINTPAHSQTVYDVASESIVLLKNEEQLLPLNKTGIKQLAVIGDNAIQTHAQGGFGAGVKAQYEITPLQGLQQKLGDAVQITFAPGYEEKYVQREGMEWFEKEPDNTPNEDYIAQAVALAKASDVAIVFAGSNRIVESEATDRKTMQLPFGQEQLIEAVVNANPKTVVVMIAGTAFDLRRVNDAASTLVWSWFNGSEAGTALTDVLFGEVNPSGKLPFTIPQQLEDSPPHATNSFPGDSMQVVYEEGVLVGYRWFDTKEVAPLYPFGYGLSYTHFEYGELQSNTAEYSAEDEVRVALYIKNNGDVAGKEIVQLYAQEMKSPVVRPTKELKAFAKVALQPGEKKEVTLTFKAMDLAYYDDKLMKWVVNPGVFKLLVGGSSRADFREAQIVIK